MISVTLCQDISLAGWTTAFCLLVVTVAVWLWFNSTSAPPNPISVPPAGPTSDPVRSTRQCVRLCQLNPDKNEGDTDIDIIATRGSGSRQHGAATPSGVQTPVCVGGFPMTADIPKPNATSIQASSGNSLGTMSPNASNATLECLFRITRIFPRPFTRSTAYCYSPLPEGCIRLLRLMPHRDANAPIQCQLFDYTLLDSGKGTHLYEALSYVWGSEEKPQSVSTDKGELRVTANLYMALKRLRDHSLDRIIWVDAICINQDDTEERNRQVQSMAKIYAKASRVVVWLEEATTGGGRVHGEATTDSDRALEELRVAASRQPKTLASGTDHQAMLTLLQRLWFQRIWVLQEVAAARQVLIMCRTTEIDGSVFCSGLDMLNPASHDPDTQSRVRSVAYLINGAIFRPKYASSRVGKFSLAIRPLGELLDMYHNRKATDPRDKIYALLGMSSDDHISAGLLPDYSISWKGLFHRLVTSLVGEKASVETWEEKEITVIKTKGVVLGWVSKVEGHGGWADQQNIHIIFKDIPGHLGGERNARWTLQASAKPIQDGDVVCFLQGASKPTIIRLFEDHCAIIAISVTPTGDKQAEGADVDWPDLLRSRTAFLCDFLLVWDWEKPCGKPEDGEDYESLMNSRALQHATEESESHLHRAARLANMGLIMGDSEKLEEAEKKVRKAADAYKRASRRELSHTLAAMDSLAVMCRGRNELKWAVKLGVIADLLGRRGDYAQITEEGMVRIATSFDQQVMTLLLDQRGTEVKITEEVVKAAARNGSSGKEVMTLLLDQHGIEITVTPKLVETLARSFNMSIMKRLLNQCGTEVKITEEVVKAAAGNGSSGKEVMTLLLDQRGTEVKITEEVVKAAAGNGSSGKEVMKLLLDQRGTEVKITEEVVKAAAGNQSKEVMTLLLDRRGTEVKITEEVVKAAAGNESVGYEVIKLLHRTIGIKVTAGMIEAAATSGQEQVLCFLDQHSSIGSDKESWLKISRLYNAAKTGDAAAVRQLVGNGTPPDKQNIHGVTPLGIASSRGHEAVAQILLATHAVAVNVRSVSGQTPLFWAAAGGHSEVVRMLLDQGAEQTYTDKGGGSPLSLARLNRQADVIDILTKYNGIGAEKACSQIGQGIGRAERM
ncbi:heterokaryon incompatibility protein-domain-containing protein [Lasiosphaeria hispida]|uniref:Heterokaryon incompatibility protein-domain-containing protein n=1 Tax=Lasiosphaeria hispida TaxID=260671 RepID=A0AAJ0MB84_9PEZI|nr:heterokaryon incompatibility protein-domain-containing protein [Lasiosphaeria hispida]